MTDLQAAKADPHCIELANVLAEARREARQVRSLRPELVPTTHDNGYAVNRMVVERLGWEPLGWKIAGTTAAVREKLGIDRPIYGRTFTRFAMQSPATLLHRELLDPLIECEFFVTLADDLPWRAQPWTEAEITAAVGEVHAGIEIAECRFPSTALPSLPAIFADGCVSGRYVYGSSIANWSDRLARIEVTLEVDGQIRRRGVGADVMGNPLAPLLWLAEELRRWGEGLRAGEMISTGSMTGMLPTREGQHVRARFGADAGVKIMFKG
jgi:2-keto-4-pentenoate hydratase